LGSAENVRIPRQIGGLPVTAIGYRAFANNLLTSVTIPNSVTAIGDWVFANNQLTSVTIPDSVTTIGYGTFGMNQLTSVTIPANVNILANAFPGDFASVYTNASKTKGTYTSGNGGYMWTR
jgi:hypothetical protein